MKRKLLHFILVTISLAIASWLPLDARKTAESGSTNPGVQITLAKQLTKPTQATLEALEPVNVPAPVIAPKPVPAAPTSASGCGDNQWANYIYSHESGCSTTAVNSIGCYGIGQNCASDVRNTCGADYACQNQWFTNYANNHCDYHLGYAICYHGWQGAYNFWLQYHYW